jgi:hypothetical protein
MCGVAVDVSFFSVQDVTTVETIKFRHSLLKGPFVYSVQVQLVLCSVFTLTDVHLEIEQNEKNSLACSLFFVGPCQGVAAASEL